MNRDNYTKVMWLEENPFTIDLLAKKAADFDLDLHTFNCWEDAKNALNSNIKGWGAILLNPACKLGRGDKPNPHKFLPQVFCDITSLCTKYNSVIPWYIVTDIDPSSFEDMIIKDRKIYDAEWERPYYHTQDDGMNLLYRVKMQVSRIERTKIRNGIHAELFDILNALTSYGLTQENVLTMEDNLIFLYEGRESNRCNFINLRKIIESLFQSMIRFKILPSDLCNVMGEINITACARLLAGMKCTSGNYNYLLRESVLDKIAAYNLYNILNICNGYGHERSNTNRLDTNNYLKTIRTFNLLQSCCLMLADIIIMYYRYIEHHSYDLSELIFWERTKYEQKMQG